VISTDVDAARVMGEILVGGGYESVFAVFIPPAFADKLHYGGRHEGYAAIRALYGEDALNSIRVHNLPPTPTATQRGKRQLRIQMAEDLVAGDAYCDGDGDRTGLAVYTAGRNSARRYLPGRLVFVLGGSR
jgi:hypothetical protein